MGASSGSSAAAANTAAELEALHTKVTEGQLVIEGLEKERDFYFGKLRDIEILCQRDDWQDLPQIQEVLKILYATEEGFEAPTEGAEGASTEF